MLQPDTSWLWTPGRFARWASRGNWRYAPHLAKIDELLVSAAGGGVYAMINIPPQHGKSEMASHYCPAWYLALYPDRRVMLASHAAEFAAKWGAAARDLLERHGPEIGIRVRGDSSARHRWEIAGHGGGMVTAGIGGSLTGRGADLLIIDDPVSGPSEASSEINQEKIWDWYRAVAFTRLQPNASVIVIQTRWHEMDLTGRLLEAEPGKWQRLALPAIAEENDPLGRDVGAALWPARFDEAYLADVRHIHSPYYWNALYQQAPSPPGGACFHRSWYRHYTITQDGSYQLAKTITEPDPPRTPIRDCLRFSTVDVAASLRTSADYTVIATWDVHRGTGRLFLVDLIRERMETPAIAPRLREVFDTIHPKYLVVERDGLGLAAIQFARKDGLPIREIRAKASGGDKWPRAQDAVAKMEGGMIAWPKEQRDFEEELASFPHGAHDDMVDALAYAAIHQSSMGSGHVQISSPAHKRLPDPRGATIR